jgi:hypothetical protein
MAPNIEQIQYNIKRKKRNPLKKYNNEGSERERESDNNRASQDFY